MVHPGKVDQAAQDMLGAAMVALGPGDEQICSSGLLGAAYERFYRAAIENVDGLKFQGMSIRRVSSKPEAFELGCFQ